MLSDKEKQVLNSDTIRSIEQILSNGWYPSWQVLGEFGWSTFYAHAGIEWKCYELDSEKITVKIFAKDDESAIKGFKSLYYLEDMSDFEIYEVITEYRTICEG